MAGVQESHTEEHPHQGCWESRLEEQHQGDVVHGAGGYEGVLRVTEVGGGAPYVGRGGHAQEEGQELPPRPPLPGVLLQEQWRHDDAGGIVGDDGRERGAQQTRLPEGVSEGAWSSGPIPVKYPEGHQLEETFPVVVVSKEHHPHQKVQGLEVAPLTQLGVDPFLGEH